MSTPRKPLGEAEFNQLFHTYHKPVFLYLRTLLARRGHPPDPHLVEDLTQEALTPSSGKSRRASWPAPTPSAGCYVTAANLARNTCAPNSGGPACWPRWSRKPWKTSPTPAPRAETLHGTRQGRGGARGAGPAPPGLPGGVQLPGAGPGTGGQAKHPGLPGEPDQGQVPKKISRNREKIFTGWVQGIPPPRT